MTPRLPRLSRAVAAEAVAALLSHRLRTLLSAAGIVGGIATVITAFAIGEGARTAALLEIGALGIDNVFVQTTAAPAGDRALPSAPVLSLADAAAIEATLDTVSRVGASRSARVEMSSDTRIAAAWVTGVTPSWDGIANLNLAAGRWLTADDARLQRRVAVIGGALSVTLFGGADPIRSRILAGGTWYLIVGRLAERRASGERTALRTADPAQSLLVPLVTMDVSLGHDDGLDRVQSIAVQVTGAAEVERASQVVTALMSRRHADNPRYEVVVPRELLRARLRTQRTFDVVLLAVSLLALVISGIGIVNIMLASVVERRNEIGVRRAVGARAADITLQCAIEAAILCGAGGLIGVPLGLALSWIVSVAAGWPVSTSLGAVLVALALAVAVGAIAGVYPAMVAARVDPIESLRAP